MSTSSAGNVATGNAGRAGRIIESALKFTDEQAIDPSHRVFQAKAYVEERLMLRIDRFAARRGLTRSTAIRRLIISGLRLELMTERRAKEHAEAVEADLVQLRLSENLGTTA